MRLTRNYTAAEIHAALIARNVAIIQNAIEEQKKEYRKIPEKIESEYGYLNSLGLGNTKNAEIFKDKIDDIKRENDEIKKHNEQIDFNKKRLEFIKETTQVFGKKVLLVTYEDFEYIINKYNLVCGLLEQYTGVIPKQNIDELDNARKTIEGNNIYTSKYIKKLVMILGVRYSIDYGKFGDYSKFPFAYITNEYMHYWIPDDYMVISSGKEASWLELNVSKPTHFFIAAPKKDMNFNESFLEKLIARPKDPFICSYTEFGMLVHTKWGEEADDEVLDKYYRQLGLIL